MGWNGVEELAEVEWRMEADQYVEILDNHLLPGLLGLMKMNTFFSKTMTQSIPLER